MGARLHRGFRSFGWMILTAIGGGTVAAALNAQDRPELPVLEGRELVLRDDDGNAYASVTRGDKGGAVLSLNDPQGKPRLSLQVRPDGTPLVRLTDPGGHDAVELSLLDDVTPRLVLRDSNDQERAKLFLMPDGSPILFLKDKAGEKRVELASMSSGGAGLDGLIIFDANQRPHTLVATVPSHNFAGLLMLDQDRQPQVQVGVDSQGRPVTRGLTDGTTEHTEGTEQER